MGGIVLSTVEEATRNRCSTRGFTPQPLTEAEISALIRAGLQAPTAANRQEVHFTVLKGDAPILQEIEDEKNRLANHPAPTANFYYGAPTVILLSADKGFRWGALDAGIAVENMALTAESMGLGSLIIGCIYDALRGSREAQFGKVLRFPENYGFEIAIALGHKAVGKVPHTYNEKTNVTYL